MCSCGFGHRGESGGRGEWAGHLILTGKSLRGLTGSGQWICGSGGEGDIRETVVARELLFDIRRSSTQRPLGMVIEERESAEAQGGKGEQHVRKAETVLSSFYVDGVVLGCPGYLLMHYVAQASSGLYMLGTSGTHNPLKGMCHHAWP